MVDYRARAVAFYLPQFHPIPENSSWWGPGFTEWTNAAKARPLFRGHNQPHLPSELGFYDLRLAESRQAQSEIAQEHGVEAFCYWHYWFGAGSRILERPFTEVLATGEPGISFCLGWANQSWTGIWHAAENTVLREQTYPGPEDDQAHFDAILPAFRDDRYLRVDDRPVFYIFRPEELPNAKEFVDRWQAMAKAAGLAGLYLVAEVSDLLGKGARYRAVVEDGFDSGVYVRLPALTDERSILRMRVRRKLGGPEAYPYSTDRSLWDEVRANAALQPSVYPNWDNTPRSGSRGLVLTDTSPQRFAANLDNALDTLSDRPAEERFLWIKSWNEWAEGNYLEPDLEHGRAWLESLAAGLAAR
jgi:lipopolysaccharide biosynthesis protein